jgi:putative ABC transport system permease protein
MLFLAFRNLCRRPWLNSLALGGLALAVGLLVCLGAFSHGYRRSLGAELDRMGPQLMLVPLGCPYDAAARVLKGKSLENSLPESAVAAARSDPAVAVAAPLLMLTISQTVNGRADMWVGLDESALALKPWWKASAGQSWFTNEDCVILGCDAAEIEMRTPGDSFFCPEAGRNLRVAGVLARSGTSDDSLFFVPLRTAQAMFHQPGRLTAIAIRLRDPALLSQAAQRLQLIPGAQVVTMTEMMGTFLNLLGAVRSLVLALSLVILAIGILSVFNTMLAAILQRANELAIMRAFGASRAQILCLIATEALLLAAAGSLAGVLLALLAGHGIESVVKHIVPFAPRENLMTPTAANVLGSIALGMAAGVFAGFYPAWRASRVQPADALKEP